MSSGILKPGNPFFVAVVVGAVVAAVELWVRQTPDGTFLVTLVFWTGVVQGLVALAAVGELAKGVWLDPIKRELLSVYPLLLIAALLSLVLGAKMEIYGWTEHPNGWLNVRFFLIRNFVVLLLTYWVARQLARAVMWGAVNRNKYAVVYVALFIVSQSLIAFDWVMSLEYPWVSTLLGGFFFIESFLMALAISALILLFRMRNPGHGLTETLRDTAKMMFGFSVVWVGFFFAQYLVIWYGNIPEEVGFVLRRVKDPPYAGLSRAVILMVWVIPFVVLLSRPLKTVPPVMAALGLVILAGLFVEKLVLVMPVTPVGIVWVLVETALMLGIVIVYLTNQYSLTQQEVTLAGKD